jgi:hypothetical protein
MIRRIICGFLSQLGEISPESYASSAFDFLYASQKTRTPPSAKREPEAGSGTGEVDAVVTKETSSTPTLMRADVSVLENCSSYVVLGLRNAAMFWLNSS